MIAFPPCKINLGLRVVRKRQDGYHDIETCFYPVPWCDVVEVIKSDSFMFSSSGLTISGSDSENLCIKAYELLKKDFGIGPINIHLHKVIPMGAGLGGGSSDAACTLSLLTNVYELNLSDDKLHQYAALLGSDCAYFLQHQPMLGSGRGEVLKPVDIQLKNKHMVIVKPEVHVSTADAYAGITPQVPKVSLENVLQLPIDQWKNTLVNDFEETVFKKYPIIKELKEALYGMGAVYACMSGSGASVYGIFDEKVRMPEEFKSLSHWHGILSI
jgi:4-diphosphocytidyl-2-C-methyl-D-erythritol kinase